MRGVTAKQKTYTTQFWMICVSSFFLFASFNMIIPMLPEYITQLGGAEYKGLIVSLFTLTALVSRPFSGKLADQVGRVPVMMFGSFVCLACGLVYPVLTSVSGFLLLRLVHGFSTGFTPTGQTAFLSDVIPATRRGEAMGILGTAGTVGMAAGPTLGGALANNFSMDAMFYCSGALGLISILVLMGIKETLQTRNKFTPTMLRIQRHEIFDWRVLVPCIAMMLTAFAYGTFLTIIPDFGNHLGVKNVGVLFGYFTVASLAVRLLGGRASDKYGRKAVLFVSISFLIAAMGIIASADTPFLLLTGITFYGLGHGITSPTLLAWATDLSDEKHKGRGLASLYMFMELGIGIGAIVSAEIYDNQSSRFMYSFLACGLLCLIAFVYLLTVRKSNREHFQNREKG